MQWFMNDAHRQVSGEKVSLEQRLAKRPQVLARFHSIADMLDPVVATGCTADEAEARAIEQVRQLGRELLGDWAQEQQDGSLARARRQHPEAIKHIKKSKLADHLWAGGSDRTVAADQTRAGQNSGPSVGKRRSNIAAIPCGCNAC